MQHGHVLKKNELDLLTEFPGSAGWGGGRGGDLQAKYLLTCCCIHDSL